MAAVFDGDPEPLYDVILEPEADEFIRSRMCEVVAMLALRDEIPRAEAERFLRAGYSDIKPQDECFVWQGWQSAIAALGLVELKPLVEQAFKRGYISPSWLRFEGLRGRPAAGDRASRCALAVRRSLHPVRRHRRRTVDVVRLQPERRERQRSIFSRSRRAMVAERAGRQSVQRRRPQRPVPLRQRQEIQEMLPE